MAGLFTSCRFVSSIISGVCSKFFNERPLCIQSIWLSVCCSYNSFIKFLFRNEIIISDLGSARLNVLSYIDTCTHFVPAIARNASWQCVPFLWHAAWSERGVNTCFRHVRALYTHFYAQFTHCAKKMTAIDMQWNDLFTHTSRYLCVPPRIAPTTSRMREFLELWNFRP